jgi:hypothetical protein
VTTPDRHGNLHTGQGLPGAGQFTAKRNSRQLEGLAPNRTPEDLAKAILDRPAPDGASDIETGAWKSIRHQLRRLLDHQAAAYVAFQAHNMAETTRQFAMSNSTELDRTAARYADDLANELAQVTGRARYPKRDATHVGEQAPDVDAVEHEVMARVTTRISPVGLTETRAAVRYSRGRDVRRVALTWDSVPPTFSGEPLDVISPTTGEPIVLDVRSGCPAMRISSGRAVIIDNGDGYGIEVADGAHATVISRPSRKTSITARPGSYVDFYPSEDSRGFQLIDDGARLAMHGRADRITLSSDRRSS